MGVAWGAQEMVGVTQLFPLPLLTLQNTKLLSPSTIEMGKLHSGRITLAERPSQ